MTTTRPKYYIGDIHGRDDLLKRMLNGIEAHAAKRNIAPEVVFLGDLTDRGPGSMQVMQMVFETLRDWKGSELILGNHDEWFRESLLHGDFYEYMSSWHRHGGAETLMSYSGEAWPSQSNLQEIKKKYPHHLEMLVHDTKRMIRNGAFTAVHAGINPSVPLNYQHPGDLNWIRDTFNHYVNPKMSPIIHGHTFWGAEPIVTENRISIDTGAYVTGRLTCCFVDPENKTIRFYQATDDIFVEVKPILLDRNYGTVYDRMLDFFDNPDEVMLPMFGPNGVIGA